VGEDPGLHFVPLHVPHTATLSNATDFWQPFIASINDISTFTMISLPFFDFSPFDPSDPKNSSRSSQKSLKFPAPAPPLSLPNPPNGSKFLI
jgi:hypothetical protein